MLHYWLRALFKRKSKADFFDPDAVLLDASNIPRFDTHQLEGRIVQPVSTRSFVAFGVVLVLVFGVLSYKTFMLQVVHGAEYADLSEKNSHDERIIFAQRGVIYDRFGRELAWNEPLALNEDGTGGYSRRVYTTDTGFGHLLGFVTYPATDQHGNWWRTDYEAKAGAELRFDTRLKGENGTRLLEIDAQGNTKEGSAVRAPKDGENITLSIDAALQQKLFESIQHGADTSGFVGGAGAIIDVHTGELLALTSYPEYESQVLSDGSDRTTIAGYNTNARKPFLNRTLSGEYAPGSIVKPFVAIAALEEGIITPEKQILSTGALVLPNPYNPDLPSIFRDWKAHGWVDMRHAIANSSDVYFYEVGGGFGTQQGLGIARLDAYAKKFGFGQETGFDIQYESLGNVPTPEWKEEVFGADDPWRIGDTYHTSIGQFGFLVTPIQAIRYAAALANDGTLVEPHIEKGQEPVLVHNDFDPAYFDIIHEGMRMGVQGGTVASLNVPGIELAGKTGTAEVGTRNQYMNSLAIGFWPYDKPRFAFAVVLERAKAGTLVGAAPSMRPFFEWLVQEYPEYAAGHYPDYPQEKK
jgi:penicillin-binding protein 2